MCVFDLIIVALLLLSFLILFPVTRYCGFQSTNRSISGKDPDENDCAELKVKDENQETSTVANFNDSISKDKCREQLSAQSSALSARTLSWPALSSSQFINDADDTEYDERADEFEVTHRAIKRHCGVHQLPKTLGAMQEVKVYTQVKKVQECVVYTPSTIIPSQSCITRTLVVPM